MLATSYAYRAALEGRSARRRAVVVRLKAQASSAVAIALGRLSENVNDYDHPAEAWCAHGALAREGWLESWSAKEDGEGAEYVADYQVVDESGKLNVNYASGLSLRKLGMSKVQVSSLFDWMDRDDIVEADGAENEYYALRPRPYRCKNGPLEVLDELLLIRGFGVWDYLGEDANHNRGCEWNENDGSESYPPDDKDGRVRMGYVDLLTCIGDGRINLNTVPGAVLRALPLSEGGVRQIEEYLSYRDGRGGGLEDHVVR